MKCKECQYFHIIQNPIKGGYDAGKAECKKHNLVVDFLNNRKLNRLVCAENEKGKIEI